MGETSARFTGLDWTVLAVYFVGITAFGLWVSRKIRSSGGYFLGDRKLPWWVMVGQSFGTGTHAENPVAQAGATFKFGFATIWYQWKNMLITPFYWLMAPWYRRCERTTIGEMMEDRYGRGMAMLYTLFAMCYFVFNQGTMMKGAGKAVSYAVGTEAISPNQVVLLMVAAFLLYSFFGGLVASAYTDFVQGFLIIIMSFLLIPAGLWAVGGFSGMRASLPDSFFDLYNESSGVDGFTILMLTLNGFIGITAQPHILTMNATGRTERAGRVGQTYGSMIKRFCTIGWALTGLIVAAMVVQQGTQLQDRESAFGYACLHLLSPGLTGLMVACILAANMSTCSNFMVNTGALFTKNLYSVYVRAAGAGPGAVVGGAIVGFHAHPVGRRLCLGRRPGAGRLHVQRNPAGLSGHRGDGWFPLAAGEPLRRFRRRGRFAGDLLWHQLPPDRRVAPGLQVAGGTVRLGDAGGCGHVYLREPCHAPRGRRTDRAVL